MTNAYTMSDHTKFKISTLFDDSVIEFHNLVTNTKYYLQSDTENLKKPQYYPALINGTYTISKARDKWADLCKWGYKKIVPVPKVEPYYVKIDLNLTTL